MNKTKIDFADYVLNPIIGCKHGCTYCYAKRMNDEPGFYGKAFKWIDKWDEPKIFEMKLSDINANPVILKNRNEIASKISPDKPIIFVGSLSDMFGDWVPSDLIIALLDVCKAFGYYNFLFLTKNPKRYNEFNFPDNCFLGTTITNNNDLWRLPFVEGLKNISFVVVEPILGGVHYLDYSDINFVIVGAMTGPGAIKPKKEWIDSIHHPWTYYKNNIKKYL